MFGFNKNKQNGAHGAGSAKSTQSFLDVAEIRDGLIILKDGNLRGILAVSSVNFSLKSENEQNAIIAAYQSFLNSLDFPIQILMQSRRMDLAPHLEVMRNKMAGQTNQLLQMQIAEYTEFIAKLTEASHIMTKSFFAVVPLNIATIRHGFLGRLMHPAQSVVLEAKVFEEHKAKLVERMAQVQQGLAGMSLSVVPLDTADIIELLYASYNIGAASLLQEEALANLDLGQTSEQK